MGWDAYATLRGDPLEHGFQFTILDTRLRAVFEEASQRVVECAGTADGFLKFGGLDCSDCAIMLERATGSDAWGDDWDSDRTRMEYEHAKWGFEIEAGELWAYESANAFLRACAENNLGIMFSW